MRNQRNFQDCELETFGTCTANPSGRLWRQIFSFEMKKKNIIIIRLFDSFSASLLEDDWQPNQAGTWG